MLCQECNGVTDVIDSRPTNRLDHKKGAPVTATRRRIDCRECGHRSTTYEFHSSDMQNFRTKSDAEKKLDEISGLIINFYIEKDR